jgi:hypothetical protein
MDIRSLMHTARCNHCGTIIAGFGADTTEHLFTTGQIAQT